MITVVTFKWAAPPGYRSIFTAKHVNVLKAMVARHYQKPHRFVCVTDDAAGIEAETIPLWTDYAHLVNPFGVRRGPSCYRRLKLFHPHAERIFGPRIVMMDLDVVVTGDLAPLFDRPEDFVIWGDTHPRTFYNGSFWTLKTGSLPEVWTDFDPVKSPLLAREAGHFGSDQGWLSYRLGAGRPTFGKADGIYSYRVHIAPAGGVLPQNARLVVFHGKHDPWGPGAQRHAWVREHWRP